MKNLVLVACLALAGCSSATKDDVSSGDGSSEGTGTGGGGTPSDMAIPPAGGPDGAVVTYTCTNEIHVAANGNDSNSGSAGAPLKTIAAATPRASAGDCVQVHAGTYPETKTIAFANDGTSTAPIVVRSADGKGAAIVDAGAVRSGPTVLVHNDYIVIDGFEFKNSPTDTGEQVVHFDGLNSNKCNGATLRNCKITGGHDHIKINSAAPGITIELNEFYGAFGHIPISLTGAPGLVFRGNYGHDWNTSGNGAVQLKGGSHDVLFDGNRFENITSDAATIAMGDSCDATCDIDPNHYAAVRVRAINNVMVKVGRGFDVQGCKDCAVLSNTIVDSAVGNVTIKLTSAATNGVTQNAVNVRIMDNVISNSAGAAGNVMQINSGSGTGLQSDYNLAWNGGKAIVWGDGHPATADTHSPTGDPKLTSSYSPGPGSAALNAGTNLVSDVPHDVMGMPRPPSGPFDIGAYEMP